MRTAAKSLACSPASSSQRVEVPVRILERLSSVKQERRIYDERDLLAWEEEECGGLKR